MAQPQRTDPGSAPATPAARSAFAGPEGSEYGYQPGGQVGQMQADLARRLAERSVAAAAAAAPEERFVRLLSVGGGYVALLAGYAATVALFLR